MIGERRQEKTRTLYVVVTVNGSVVRLISFCRGKNSFSNSSGSHGTVVYRDFSVWEST